MAPSPGPITPPLPQDNYKHLREGMPQQEAPGPSGVRGGADPDSGMLASPSERSGCSGGAAAACGSIALAPLRRRQEEERQLQVDVRRRLEEQRLDAETAAAWRLWRAARGGGAADALGSPRDASP
jgi:hypothetical protein